MKNKYLEVKDIDSLFELKEYKSKKIVIEGNVSNIYWQHLIGYEESHPEITYLDVSKTQTVLYSKEKITCSGKIRVYGTVIEILGGGEKGSKLEESPGYCEYHIIVDKFECIK